jgi:hypothetical protein
VKMILARELDLKTVSWSWLSHQLSNNRNSIGQNINISHLNVLVFSICFGHCQPGKTNQWYFDISHLNGLVFSICFGHCSRFV